MSLLLPNLAIVGYRSFGKTPQHFDNFSKINLSIGQNDAGKSNVLGFIHKVIGKWKKTTEFVPELLDKSSLKTGGLAWGKFWPN